MAGLRLSGSPLHSALTVARRCCSYEWRAIRRGESTHMTHLGHRLFAAALAASLVVFAASAGAADPTRQIRGTVVEARDGKAAIKTNGGKTKSEK